MGTVSKLGLNGFSARELVHAGARVRYLVAGDGPPLVLVHGLGGTIDNWRLVAPELARDHRVIVPDLPGHGGSESPRSPGGRPELDLYADAVLAVLELEEALPAAWIGHSLGGTIGLHAAARRPGAVRGLVLAAAAGISSSTRLSGFVIEAIGVVRPGRLVSRRAHAVARSRLGRTLTLGWWGVADPEGLDAEAAEAFLGGPRRHTDLRSAGRALVAGDPRTLLDGVSCPCLCLWGGQDNWVPLQDGMEYARRLGAHLRVIADCGHLLIGEQPAAVVAAVREFLASLPQR